MLKLLAIAPTIFLALLRCPPLRAEVDFTREVRPILAQYCFKCHGLDEGARKGNLRLDRREDALQSGESGSIAITPSAPEKSEIIRRIVSTDPDEIMPPPSAKHALSPVHVKVLTQWVREGAKYQPHWSFQPPLKPTPPAYHEAKHLSAHPIDRFIGEHLARKGLRPSEPAQKETLLRRLSLDLVGLPPTPAETRAFVNDRSDNAYEKAVDQLLASPRYGERWAKKWLDLARYADTNGYEKDRPRSIWPFRDWVIRALNEDMPFDRFTIEQIAGDMLPSPTPDQLIATGFHRNTMINEEGGVDPLEFRFHAMTDRVATTGSTWLGLTLGCAQCHTHKSDPILHREYYQLLALLNNADEPELELRDQQHDEAAQKNREQADVLLRNLSEKWPIETGPWSTPTVLSVTQSSAQPATIDSDGTIITFADSPETESTTIHLRTTERSLASLRLEAIPDKRLPAGGPGRARNGNFVLSEIEVYAKPIGAPNAEETRLSIASAEASIEQDRFPVKDAFDHSPKTGWAIDPGPKRGPLNVSSEATFQFEKPFQAENGIQLRIVLHQQFGSKHILGKFRLSVPTTPLSSDQVAERRKQSLDAAFTAWINERSAHAATWTPLKPVKATSNLPLLTPLPDHSIVASGDISKDDTYDIHFDAVPAGTTALRLEALPDSSLPANGPGLTYYEGPKGDFFLGEFSASQDNLPLVFTGASESYSANNFGSAPVTAALALDGDPQTGWSCAKRPGVASWAVFPLEKALPKTGPLRIKMRFGRHYACSLGKFRISATTSNNKLLASDIPTGTEVFLTRNPSTWSHQERESLLHAFLLSTPQLAQDSKQIKDLLRPISGPTTLVLRERPKSHPRITHLHHRGEFLQPKAQVEPEIPEQLRTPSTPPVHSRLDFAKWLVSPENPLTARVLVNRHWAAFFGRGIVKTQADFGIQGDAPSHPELLDWLARQFQENGWSMKKLHRLIVTSRTYQQSSVVTPETLKADPENVLLARGPRSRLEAEQIRDVMLHASGLLSPKMFGPSVYPPQPQGVTEAAYGGGAWNTSQGEDRYRRSLYTFMKRSAPFAMLGTFDAPSGEVCVARRENTNTPLQSLTLLNDDAFMEMARHAGKVAAESAGDDETRLTELHLRFTGRSPDVSERENLQRYLTKQRARLTSGELKADALQSSAKSTSVESAAWTLVVRALMNLDETITKN